MLGMNKLPLAKRAQILAMLCEGASMRSVSRLADVSINTVSKLLVDAGKACAAFHDDTVLDVRVQARAVRRDLVLYRRLSRRMSPPGEDAASDGAGDTWTWTALDADTKLIVSHFVGGRDGECAMMFMDDVAKRLATRVQLTTDGHRAYLDAVEGAFGCDVDFAQLVKIYGAAPGSRRPLQPCRVHRGEEDEGRGQARPRPRLHILRRAPEPHHADAHAPVHPAHERLSRRSSRTTPTWLRSTRLWYNFVRVHKSLRVSPAMAAGISDRLWSMEDLAGLVEAADVKPGKRGSYKKVRSEVS